MSRGNVQSGVGYRVCVGSGGVVLCKSRDLEAVEDGGGVLNMGGQEIGWVGGRKGHIYSSSSDLIHMLRFVGK
jgi:hypothetical protein